LEEQPVDAGALSADGGRAASPEASEPVTPEVADSAEAEVDAGPGDAGAVSSDSVDEAEDDDIEEEEEEVDYDVAPLELLTDEIRDEDIVKDWYILKVQVNREESIRDALQRRVKIAGLERFFSDIVVPTEDVAEFSKSGKRRIVKRKLYPGYIMVHMSINDDTWFLVRETPGIGDFTGSAGKPSRMDRREVERILSLGASVDSGDSHVKTAIPFRAGDRVRVKEGYFQNFEGDVESVDEANGRVTVMINIFGRSTPVELEHWQVEAV
jgi:transcriptional antiterminator NusG